MIIRATGVGRRGFLESGDSIKSKTMRCLEGRTKLPILKQSKTINSTLKLFLTEAPEVADRSQTLGRRPQEDLGHKWYTNNA